MAGNQLEQNMRVDINTIISPDLQHLMKSNPELAPKWMKYGLRAITTEGAKQVRAQIRSDGLVRSGTYAKSVRGSTTNTKSVVGSRAYIANILENGAKPHTIKPKRDNPTHQLRLMGGRWVSQVHHPGIKAYRPFDVVWERMQSGDLPQTLFAQGFWKAYNEVTR